MGNLNRRRAIGAARAAVSDGWRLFCRGPRRKGSLQVREALLAFSRCGKGMNPRARLNLSESAAYALAKTKNLPLLFKGTDFQQTGVRPVV